MEKKLPDLHVADSILGSRVVNEYSRQLPRFFCVMKCGQESVLNSYEVFNLFNLC